MSFEKEFALTMFLCALIAAFTTFFCYAKWQRAEDEIRGLKLTIKCIREDNAKTN